MKTMSDPNIKVESADNCTIRYFNNPRFVRLVMGKAINSEEFFCAFNDGCGNIKFVNIQAELEMMIMEMLLSTLSF
jgi:hypothetical protein